MTCLLAAEVMRQGAPLPSGYWAWTHRSTVYAHRHVYEECVGPIPPGMEIHHTCGTRDCVNPEHMSLVEHLEHIEIHRRTHCKNGHPMSGDNLIRDPFPRCRTCRDERQKAYRSTEEYRARRREYRRKLAEHDL